MIVVLSLPLCMLMFVHMTWYGCPPICVRVLRSVVFDVFVDRFSTLFSESGSLTEPGLTYLARDPPALPAQLWSHRCVLLYHGFLNLQLISSQCSASTLIAKPPPQLCFRSLFLGLHSAMHGTGLLMH